MRCLWIGRLVQITWALGSSRRAEACSLLMMKYSTLTNIAFLLYTTIHRSKFQPNASAAGNFLLVIRRSIITKQFWIMLHMLFIFIQWRNKDTLLLHSSDFYIFPTCRAWQGTGLPLGRGLVSIPTMASAQAPRGQTPATGAQTVWGTQPTRCSAEARQRGHTWDHCFVL